MHTRTTLQPCSCRVIRAPRKRAHAPSPAALTVAASLSVGALAPAMAGPTGGVVVEGQGSISTPDTNTTVINQSSQNLQLNWSTFNVGASEGVQFNQPSSKAVAFNRILDQNPSQIFGRLDANGQVVLVNPNGLLIGRTAQLNVNSLVASSLDAIDFDAASGRYRFSTSRSDPGAVINDGTIAAGAGGSVTLLGGRVSNTGSILADYGTVNLASGSAATIDLAGDGLLRLEVGSDLLANGDRAASAVENGGAIQANGGRVLLTASAMDGVFANLINNTGVVRANRIENTGGVITLLGPEGKVLSSGTLDASAGDAVSTGGSVSVLGDRVGLPGNAVVDVSGAIGGGTAFIGGDYQGSNPDVLNASRTFVSAGATLNADAGTQGDGGRIIVWSSDLTRYEGSLSANGGSLWGDGGFAEVSGKHFLSFAGRASLTAPHGAWGTLLLDPTDITISTSATTAVDLNADYDATADDPGVAVTIQNTDIEALLGSTSVKLQATHGITQDAGADINVSNDAGAQNNSLTLETTGSTAGSDITLDAQIHTNDGAVILNSIGGAIALGGAASVNSGSADVTLTAAKDITLGGITSLGRVDVTSSTGKLLNNATPSSTTRVTASDLHLTANGGAGEIGSIGAGNAIDTDVATLTAQTSGGLYINERDGVQLTSLTSTSGSIEVTTANGGDIHTRSIQASTGVHLNAAGSIVDDSIGTGIASTSGTVDLDAGGNIGTVTDFLLRQGTPVRITSASKIAASTASSAAQINLSIPSFVVVDAGGIQLGTGSPRTGPGQILLQSTSFLDASLFAAGAIDIGTTNDASVALGTNGTLTLRTTGSITNAPARTLLLHGGDIGSAGNANQASVDADNLILEIVTPFANKTFDTTAQKLTATVGLNRDLTVNQTGSDLELRSISAGSGTVSITATGRNLTDDGAGTAITAGSVILDAARIGASGNEIDTHADTLDLTSTATSPLGGVFVREAGNVTPVSVTASAVGGMVDVATIDGAMDVQSASGIGVKLETAGTVARDLTIKGAVNGNGNAVTLTSGANGSPRGNVAVVGVPIVSASALTVSGATIGVVGGALRTTASSINSASTNGATNIIETDGLNSLVADATGGALNVQTTNGSMTVNTATGDGVTLIADGVGNVLQLNGPVEGNNGAVLLAANGASGALFLNSTVNTTGAVTLHAGAFGAQGAVVAGGGNLITGSGIAGWASSVGTAGSELNTSTASINLNTSAGGFYVRQASGPLSLNVTATGGDVDVTAADGALTVASATGSNVTLTTGGTNNDLTLNGLVHAVGGGSVVLDASGDIVAGGSNQVTAVSLTANADSIGVGGRLATTVASLDTTTSGDTFITELDGVNLTAISTGGKVDVLTTGGAMNVTSASGATGVTLTAGGAGNGLTINGAVGGGTGAVALTASGDAGDINLNSTITTSGSVSLTAGSPTTRGAIAVGASNRITAGDVTLLARSIGDNVTSLETTASTLDATSTAGDTYVLESDGLTLTASATGGTVNVSTANGALDVTSAVGDGVALDAGGANNLSVNGVVNGRTGGTVSLTAGNRIVAGTGNSILGATLNATGAAIGDVGARLNTSVVTLNTTSTNGGTFITETDAVSLDANVTNGALDVETTNGALTVPVANRTGTGGGVRLVAGGANNALTVSGAVAGGNGAVDLEATGDNGNINLGGGVITTGDVTIAAGSATNRGAIAFGGGVTGNVVNIVGTSIGTSGGPLLTTATALNATSTNGGIFVRETDGLALSASATGGELNVETLNGALGVTSASGAGVTLTAGGASNGITVDGLVNAGANDVTLAAQGAIAAGAGNLVAANALDVTGASIGGPGARLNTAVATLSTNTTSGGTFVSEADALTLTASAVGGAVDVQTFNGSLTVSSVTGNGATLVAGGFGNGLDVNRAVNGGAGDVTLGASGLGGAINLNAPVTTTANVILTAGGSVGSGAIVAGAGEQITANALTAKGASIGTIGARLAITATSLDATSTSGGIYVTEADALTLTASATGGSLDVETTNGALSVTTASATGLTLITNGDGNDLNINGPVNGGVGVGDVTLQTLGAGSNIRLAGVVTSPGSVTLSAGSPAARGAIIADAGNAVVGSSLLASGSSIGSAGVRLNTDVASLNATSTNGFIRIAEANGLDLTALATGGLLDVTTANGPLTVFAAHGDLGVNLAVGGNNDLNVNGAISGGNSAVSLTSGGGITAGAGNLVASDSLAISAVGAGTSSSRLNTQVNSLNATTSGAGLYISESDALSLTASATGGALDVRTGDGALTVNAASGDGVTLMAAGNGNSITVNGAVTSTAGVTIAAGSAAQRGAVASGTNGNIVATSVDLTGSAIGAAGARVKTTAGSVTANSTNGGIYLNSDSATDLTANAIGGAVDVQAGGALSVAAATGDGVTLATNAPGAGISANGQLDAGTGAVVLTAGTSTNRGVIATAGGGEIRGASLVATGSAIGSAANRLDTRVATLSTTSTNGGTYVREADGLALTANATGGFVDVQTTNGSLIVNAASGPGVSLRVGGTGSSITLSGNIDAGTSGDVTLAASGAIVGGAGRVVGRALDATGSAIGSSLAQLNTSIDSLNAAATNGDINVSEQSGLSLVDVHATGNVAVAAVSGDIVVATVGAGNGVSLTASSGAITDDGVDTTRLTGSALTLLARSIGAPSTLAGATLDSKLRLDTDAATIDATATGGGIFIDELNGVDSLSVQATGGTAGDIELLTATGDLNLRKVMASDTLLLAAGHNIFALPGLGSITARAAELRAGGADSSAGQIGSLADPLKLQLDAGNTLRMFVPQTVDPQDPTRAPATLPSAGVLSTLSLFNAPHPASVQAGFGQFLGVSDTQFTSPAEALVRAIQNQTSTVQTVVGLDWASFDPNVSLFGTLDPAVCLPGDQRDEEQGASGC